MNIVDTNALHGAAIPVLWTGGWDSTYRVVELSMQEVVIQPVYILDKNRASRDLELNAIETITQILKAKEETKAEFLPLRVIPISELPVDEKTSAAAAMLRDEFGMGIQHDWTARAALLYPGIEMCIEKVTKGYMPIRESIGKYGVLKMSAHGYVVDQEKSEEPLRLIFGNIVLPIFETTELAMRENIKQWGYEDVMAHIWFCHNPIDGKPCGLCSPCHTKWDSQMDFLLPRRAQVRCRRAAKIEQTLGAFAGKAYKKLARMIKVI